MQANTHILFSQHHPAAKWHIAEPGLSVSVTNVIRTLSQIIWLCVMNSKDTKRFLSFSLSAVCLLKFWRFYFQCCETWKTNKSHDWSANVNCESADWNAYRAHLISLYICVRVNVRQNQHEDFLFFLPWRVKI